MSLGELTSWNQIVLRKGQDIVLTLDMNEEFDTHPVNMTAEVTDLDNTKGHLSLKLIDSPDKERMWRSIPNNVALSVYGTDIHLKFTPDDQMLDELKEKLREEAELRSKRKQGLISEKEEIEKLEMEDKHTQTIQREPHDKHCNNRVFDSNTIYCCASKEQLDEWFDLRIQDYLERQELKDLNNNVTYEGIIKRKGKTITRSVQIKRKNENTQAQGMSQSAGDNNKPKSAKKIKAILPTAPVITLDDDDNSSIGSVHYFDPPSDLEDWVPVESARTPESNGTDTYRGFDDDDLEKETRSDLCNPFI